MTDYSYTEYNEAVTRAINNDNPELVVKDDRFYCNNERCGALPYPGYSIMAMIEISTVGCQQKEVLINAYNSLSDLEKQYGLFILNPDSWHITIANLLSGEKYISQIERKGLNDSLPNIIEKSFLELSDNRGNGLLIKVAGIGFMNSCIVAYHMLPSEKDYEAILNFRKKLYSLKDLDEMGIGFTRPFLGHTTLAYLGRELSAKEKKELKISLEKLNQKTPANTYYQINSVELRNYQDLTSFSRNTDSPIYKI